MTVSLDAVEIYREFPRKKDKAYAVKCIARAIARLQQGETGKRMGYEDAVLFLLEAVQNFANSCDGRTVIYPAMFMNQSLYLKPYEEVFPSPQEARIGR